MMKIAKSSSRPSVVVRAAAGKAQNLYVPKFRQLGDSDLMVPDVCLGTMTWGEQNTEAEAHEQLNYSLEVGCNFIDTAEIYAVPTKPETAGLTEKYIGSWLKNIRRDKVIVATKVAGASPRITWLREDKKKGTELSKAQILEAVDKSLQRLGTDYIDLYQLHWPSRYVPLFGAPAYDLAMAEAQPGVPLEETVSRVVCIHASSTHAYLFFCLLTSPNPRPLPQTQLEALDTLVKSGKVRHIGVSNETSYGVSEFTRLARTKGLPKIVSIQNSYSLLVRVPFETDLAETCAPKNCNVGLLGTCAKPLLLTLYLALMICMFH